MLWEGKINCINVHYVKLTAAYFRSLGWSDYCIYCVSIATTV